MKHQFRFFLFLFIGFFAIGIGSFFYYRYRSQYELVPPKRGSITEAIYGLGKVKPYNKYDVKLGVLNTVQKILVREGDLVKKGDLLIRFNEALRFFSPINGTVTFVGVDEAEAVAPQTIVLSVQDLSEKYVEVSLEQQGALRVRRGQKADVLFESLRGEKFEGHVKALFPKNDEFLAHIQVDGLKENVLPGMTADVSIQVGQHDQALLVPLSAVSSGKINIERNNKRIKIPVKIGGIDGQWAEIQEGDLKDEDLVVVRKHAK